MPRKVAAKPPPPTPGGPRTISMADARAFGRYVTEITAREGRIRESATRFLIESGFLDKKGELAPMYRARKGE